MSVLGREMVGRDESINPKAEMRGRGAELGMITRCKLGVAGMGKHLEGRDG